ncbi:MAG: hypothetical protein U9R25_06215 [Chloroflexota bacterium]|nr:hypothetical protein [Chloroflexota bacterium]
MQNYPGLDRDESGVIEALDLIREGLAHLEEYDRAPSSNDGQSFSEEEKIWLRKALECFQEAEEFAPYHESWLSFQIGWCSLPFVDDPRMKELAVKELGMSAGGEFIPGYVALTLLLLDDLGESFDPEQSWADYHLYREKGSALSAKMMEKIKERSDFESKMESLRTIKGEMDALKASKTPQIKIVEYFEEITESDEFFYYLEGFLTTLFDGRLEVNYFSTKKCLRRFFGQLKELGRIVPEDKRAWYFNIVGIRMSDDTETGQEWYAEAVKWESGDPEDLFLANTHLGICLYYNDGNNGGAIKAYLKGYDYLRQTEDPAKWFWYWFPYFYLGEDFDPGEALPQWLELIKNSMNLDPFDDRLSVDISNGQLADQAEAAGRLLVKRDEHALAETYLRRAEQFDPSRTSVVRWLAESALMQQEWSRALEHYRRLADLGATDQLEAWVIPMLELAVDQALNRQARDVILTGIPQLLAGQELLLDEVMVQRDLLQQVADAQRRAQRQLTQRKDEERTYDDLFENLHNLVQEGSRIQPSFWRAAHGRVLVELGEEVYGNLESDSQHFLLTAETFYHASPDVATDIDSALIAVEYAKVVENELKKRLLEELVVYLTKRKYSGALQGRKQIKKYGKNGWSKRFEDLGLGDIGQLLKKAGDHDPANKVVLAYVKTLGYDAAWLEQLGSDVFKVADEYRNGAAHTKGLDRAKVEEFRHLLFRGNLLGRLVEIGRQVEEMGRQA